MGYSARRQAIAAGVLAFGFAIGTAAQSPVKPAAKADGLLHSELSLLGRTASISYAPDVRPPSAGQAGPLRIGELQTNGTIRFGNLSIGKPMGGLTSLRFDLLLEPTSDGWQLDITGPETPGSATKPASLGKVALSRQKSAAASPTLSAALVPVARDSALLVLKWGDVTATAGVQFQEVQLPARGGGGRQTAPVSRNHDDENVGARATMLSQMNEAALVDPQGARFSVTFARTFPKGTASQSAAGTTRRAGLVVEGPDFGRLMSTRDGAVVELTEAPALRLSIDRAVQSGKLVLRPGNQTAGFPGAYSLWLKRAGSGWRLVINQEPDVWGSQRDPKSDVGEIDLTYSQRGDSSRPLGVGLEPTSADRWRMVLAWGPHEWSADFTSAQ